jgi:hypothetical protein
MKHAVLCDGETFRLERWGGGLSYALTHKGVGRTAFMQGDDALRFDQDFLDCEDAFPDYTTEQIARRLWVEHGYSEATQP